MQKFKNFDAFGSSLRSALKDRLPEGLRTTTRGFRGKGLFNTKGHLEIEGTWDMSVRLNLGFELEDGGLSWRLIGTAGRDAKDHTFYVDIYKPLNLLNWSKVPTEIAFEILTVLRDALGDFPCEIDHEEAGVVRWIGLNEAEEISRIRERVTEELGWEEAEYLPTSCIAFHIPAPEGFNPILVAPYAALRDTWHYNPNLNLTSRIHYTQLGMNAQCRDTSEDLDERLRMLEEEAALLRSYRDKALLFDRMFC